MVAPQRGARRESRLDIGRVAPLALILIAFAMRVHRLGEQSLWFDEGWSAFVAALPPLETLKAIAAPGHTHPPGYYLALAAWIRLAGSSETALRYLSVVEGVLLVVVGAALTARSFGKRAGLLALAALAGLPALVVYSQETRMYTQLALLYVALAWVLAEIANRRRPPPRSWIALLTLEAAAIYTHYFAAILIAWLLLASATAIWLRESGRDRRGKLGRLALVQMLCAAAYLPWLGTAVRQLSEHTPRAASPPTLTSFLSTVWLFFNSGVLGMAHVRPKFGWAAGAAAALLALVLFAALVRARSSKLSVRLGVTVVSAAVPLAAVFVVSQGRPGVHPRYVLMAAPPLMMALGAGLAWLIRPAPAPGEESAGVRGARLRAAARLRSGTRQGSAARLVVAALTAATFAAAWALALGAYYSDEAVQRDDVRSVAAAVAARATSADLVVLDYDDHAFRYYYERDRGEAPLHTLNMLAGDEDEGASDGTSEVADAGALERLVADARPGSRVFAVGWNGGGTDFGHAIPALLERVGRLEQRQEASAFLIDRYIVTHPEMATMPSPTPLTADFGQLRLTAAAVPAIAPADDALVIATRWACDVTPDQRLKAVVEVIAPWGDRIAQADTALVDPRGRETDSWPVRAQAAIYSVIPLPIGSPPGEYTIRVGLYGADDLADLELRDEEGLPAGTRRELGTVTVTAADGPGTDPYDTSRAIGLRELDAAVSPDLTVAGVALDAEAATPGSSIGASVLWRADRALGPGAALPEVRLAVDGGQVTTFPPSPAVVDYAPGEWHAGELVLDRRRARIPPGLTGETATVEVVAGGRATVLAELPVAAVPHEFVEPDYQIPDGTSFTGVGDLVGFSLEADGACRLEADASVESPQAGVGAGHGAAPRAPAYSATLSIDRADDCRLQLDAVWRAEGPSDVDLTVFNHLLAAPDGPMIAQHDGRPVGGSRPTTGWISGEYIVDEHELTFVDGPLPSGPMVLAVGLYDPATMDRVGTSDGADRAVLNVLLTIEAPSGARP
ncbi:MAG: glycosyltransferase family 39 protein [Anaerolineae bacterium]